MPFYLIFVCLFLGLLIGRSSVVRLYGTRYLARVIQGSFFLLLFTMGYALRQRSEVWERGGTILLLAFFCAVASGLGSILIYRLIAAFISSYEE